MPIKVTVIYRDTAEGVRAQADAVAAVAWNTGADVRLRRLPGARTENPQPEHPQGEDPKAEQPHTEQAHADPKPDPPATARDLSWADVIVLGAPARDREVFALLRSLADSATASATESAAREMRNEWERRSAQQVFAVFVTTPAPGTRHGGLIHSFAITYRPAPGSPDPAPQRSITTLTPTPADDPTLLSLDLARIQTRRCVELAAALRAARTLPV
ncbi:hypothetical protein [Embleya sp. NPDC005971]|uniref:hypothetical protein n=1 Tax=unclassified Embleya TaxID=2699296 RepID=UPI0033C194D4